MARKRKRRGDAAATGALVEVAEQEAPEAAAANSATPKKTERRRGCDATAEQQASAAVHVPGPAYSGKETRDREGKKPKINKQKRNKTDRSPRAPASDAVVAATGKSGDDCTDGVGVLGDAQVSMNPRNGGDTDRPEVNDREKGTPGRKKPKRRHRKNNTQQLCPSAVSDDNAVEVDKSRTDCKDVEGVPGDDETIRSLRNEEDPGFSAVKIAEQEIPERKTRRLKKRKDNKQEQSPVSVTGGDTVLVGTSGNNCTHGKGVPGVADVSMSSRNGEDQDCPDVNIAEKETLERKKPKLKKLKENKQEQSPAAVSHDGVVQSDKSGNGCIDGDAASGDGQVSTSYRNIEDPYCPEVNISEKITNERKKPKPKKRKNKKEGSSSVVLDAGAVVADESGNVCTNVDGDGAPQDIEAGICPRNGEDPDCPVVNNAEKGIPEVYKPKRKKQKKNSHEQSPSAVLDAGDVVVGESGHDSTNVGAPSSGADGTTSPGIGEGPEYPKLNATDDLLEGKNGNNGNSQKPKNKKRRRKKRAQVVVTETPPVGDVSLDERKDVCRTGYMKVTDKLDTISITSSGGNHKKTVQDIYSPEGSLVRFRRKKLLILDLNGILADINTDRDVAHMADGRVRGKNVFKRPYFDDFLRFCFQNFELGIWSSRMKANVDAVVDILMKNLRRHLVFCWDMSKCTTTNVATLENDRKPLVLKELKKLWNKEDPDLPWEQGEFSPSNTLLVDDSPYKALRNPQYTAIFPQSYSYHIKDDESLGPGGDLRVYLENIAAADDVQRYVQEHPFGQPAITESDPHWHFYAKIH